MENHPIPRSVTSFEFKLIGWFTVKEFIYLLLAVGIAVILYFVIPVPYLNIFLSALVVAGGAILVFYKYNERPLDSWIKNLVYRLLNPTQYLWHKENPVPEFLSDVVILADAQIVDKHIDASQKLQSYIDTTNTPPPQESSRADVEHLIKTPTGAQAQNPSLESAVPQDSPEATDKEKPYLSGVVMNNKELPLPNIMVYINSHAGELVRILKTNKNGVFASFHPLPGGTYVLSPKDLGGTYFFDTMTVAVDGPQKEPVQIRSKELL